MEAQRRTEILQLLADGKITAAEAVSLLDSNKIGAEAATPTEENDEVVKQLETDEVLPQKEPEEIAIEELKTSVSNPDDSGALKITKDDLQSNGKTQRPRWLKIRVSELDSGHNRVNITIPLSFVGFGLNVARRFGADFEEFDQTDEFWKRLKEGDRGVLVDVEDEEDNEHVQIYLD